jgi:hypothetical protein
MERPERRNLQNRPARIDSRPETFRHIEKVQKYLGAFIMELMFRQQEHDQSKLVEPELTYLNEWTPRLADVTYDSPEYKGYLEQLAPMLAHHYAHNPHHPQHFASGVRGMNLMDIVEMLCDWKAASERHDDGDLLASIEKNQQRFGYSDELKQILINTVPLFAGAGRPSGSLSPVPGGEG